MANPRSGKKKTTFWDTILAELPHRPMEPEHFGDGEVTAAFIRRLPVEVQEPVMTAIAHELSVLSPSKRLAVSDVLRAFNYIRRFSK